MAVLSMAVLLQVAARGEVYFDPPGGTGVWDNDTANWNGGLATWPANGNAVFNGAGSAVTIGDNLEIGSLTLSATAGSYTFNNTVGAMMDFNGAGIATGSAASQTFNNTGIINFNAGASAGTATVSFDNQGDLTFSGAGATAGSAQLANSGNLNFESGSTAGSASINNLGNLLLSGSANGGSATVSNGSTFDISDASGTVTLGSLTNSAIYPGPQALNGAITLGLNTLQVSGPVSLATTLGSGNNSLSFELDTPTTSGAIALAGLLTGSASGMTDISLTSTGPVAAGAYVLLDWSAGSATGVELSDFTLTGPLPAGVGPGSYLDIIGGNQLALIAVPEPGAFALVMAGIVGMAVSRPRRTRTVRPNPVRR